MNSFFLFPNKSLKYLPIFMLEIKTLRCYVYFNVLSKPVNLPCETACIKNVKVRHLKGHQGMSFEKEVCH